MQIPISSFQEAEVNYRQQCHSTATYSLLGLIHQVKRQYLEAGIHKWMHKHKKACMAMHQYTQAHVCTQTYSNSSTCLWSQSQLYFVKPPETSALHWRGTKQKNWYFSHDCFRYLSHWTPQGRPIWKPPFNPLLQKASVLLSTFPRSLEGEKLPVLPAHCGSGVLSHQDFKGTQRSSSTSKFQGGKRYIT